MGSIIEDMIGLSPRTVNIRQVEATKLLGSLEPGSVQMIFTDPPYGIAYHSHYYKDKNPHAPVSQDWNFRISPFFVAASKVLAEGGALYLCCRWDVMPIWVQAVPATLSVKNAIIWVKDNWSAGDLTGNFGFQYEVILFIVKGRHHLRSKRWPNVWEFPRVPSRRLLHPTEKPVGLVKRAIEASSDPGDVIVDPFCGSGTVGEGSPQRNVILGDIDPACIRIACNRLGVEVPKLEEPEPVVDCPVFQLQPPSPLLWGVHPEDLAYFKQKFSQEHEED